MTEVEDRLKELREIVDGMWARGEVEKASAGEGAITAIGQCRDAVDNMVDKFTQWMRDNDK